MPNSRLILQPATRVSPTSLRAEGIIELGRVAQTSVLFVRTRKRLYLFHVESLPNRTLDDYAVNLAVNWIENGASSRQVARDLEISEPNLCRALAAAGYERLARTEVELRRHQRIASKLGNRRGRLVRVEVPA
jgi:hypothetical protein